MAHTSVCIISCHILICCFVDMGWSLNLRHYHYSKLPTFLICSWSIYIIAAYYLQLYAVHANDFLYFLQLQGSGVKLLSADRKSPHCWLWQSPESPFSVSASVRDLKRKTMNDSKESQHESKISLYPLQ